MVTTTMGIALSANIAPTVHACTLWYACHAWHFIHITLRDSYNSDLNGFYDLLRFVGTLMFDLSTIPTPKVSLFYNNHKHTFVK